MHSTLVSSGRWLPILGLGALALPGQTHWAFVPPVRPELPPATDWCRDPLDRLVLAELQRNGRAPAPPADPHTWLRRVTLALTGLPPQADEVAAFLADASPVACERVVDRLLASPACAERMAADWLDLARYADTYGYQADFECRVWPWRDWVLQAFLADLPYDRFVTAQLAGDLLADADDDSRLATAFLRLHRQTNEGGSIPAEFRQENIADRVHTFGTAFLGLTFECARCHDHKYDPLTQRDYYALAGLFAAIDETGVCAYTTGACPPPALALPDAAQRRQLQQRREAVASAAAALAGTRAQVAQARESLPAPPPPVPIAHWPLHALVEASTPSALAGGAAAQVAPGLRLAAFAGQPALALDGDAGITCGGLPAFTRDQPFSLSLRLWVGEHGERQVVLHTSAYTIEADAQGYQLLLRDGHLHWELVHCWPGSALAVATLVPLAPQRWHEVTVTYDGSSRADGAAIWLAGRRAPTRVVRDGLDGVATARTLVLGARDRDRGLRGGAIADLRVFDRALLDGEIPGQPPPAPGSAAAGELAVARHERVLAAAARLQAERAALHALQDALPRIMVMRDRQPPTPHPVLVRGAYDQPDPAQLVAPGAPAWLCPPPAGAPADRLGLAQWLFAPQHPLTARVAVDRLWRLCWHRGLVATPEDFGRRGAPPRHQAVLDLLAQDLVASGWRLRPLLRRIVLSAAFRQSSAATAADWAADPDNDLLARGPAGRLSAEMLRDQALLASGLLVQRLGGPSVRPWQPPGLWRDAGVGWGGGDYQPDTGENAHRRSLYTWRKRTAPPPNMVLFDAPTREVCVARRQSTDTPLQPLVLLNDPVFVECARALAGRAVDRDPAVACARMFAWVCGRPATPRELDALVQLIGTVPADGADAAAPLVLAASTILASDAAVVCR